MSLRHRVSNEWPKPRFFCAPSKLAHFLARYFPAVSTFQQAEFLMTVLIGLRKSFDFRNEDFNNARNYNAYAFD
jgi:hypothetical protein